MKCIVRYNASEFAKSLYCALMKRNRRETPGSESGLNSISPWAARQSRRIQSKQTGHGLREPYKRRTPLAPVTFRPTSFHPNYKNSAYVFNLNETLSNESVSQNYSFYITLHLHSNIEQK